MSLGICLILVGVYCYMYSDIIEVMGFMGIVISVCLVVVGMIMLLFIKMYLIFMLVKCEVDVVIWSN